MPARKISLVGRNADRVRALSKITGAESLMREQLTGRKFDAVVHATPLGMFPHTNECFFDGDIPGEVVFDHGLQPDGDAAAPARAGAGQDGRSRASKCSSSRRSGNSRSGPARRAPRAVMQKAALEALETQK